MAVCVAFDEQGVLRMTESSVDECESFVLVSTTEYTTALKSIEISPLTVTTIFSSSFMAVVILAAAAFKVKTTRSIVRMG